VTFVSEKEQRDFADIERFLEREVPKRKLPAEFGETPAYRGIAKTDKSGKHGRNRRNHSNRNSHNNHRPAAPANKSENTPSKPKRRTFYHRKPKNNQ
jgi:superfamily II DNA/RNA helicase